MVDFSEGRRGFAGSSSEHLARDSATYVAGHQKESCEEVHRHVGRNCRSSMNSWTSDSNSDVTRISDFLRPRCLSTRTSRDLQANPQTSFMMPASSFNVISGESHGGNLLACSAFLIVPTETGIVAEDMIIDTEVHHLLKFGHQKDVRRDVLQFNSETSNSFGEFFLSWIRVSCHVANEESLHVFRSARFPRNVRSESCAETCWSEKRLLTWNHACLWFVGRREDDVFDDE